MKRVKMINLLGGSRVTLKAFTTQPIETHFWMLSIK